MKRIRVIGIVLLCLALLLVSMSCGKSEESPQNGMTDTTPPIISAVVTAGVADRSATIEWSTDEPATSQIEYGLSASYGNITSLDSSLTTSHSKALTVLEPNTSYHYRVVSKDADGNTASSDDFSFVTLQDTTSPNAPSGLALTAGYKEVKVAWPASIEADVAGYNIYRSGSVDSGFVRVNSGLVAGALYLDTGLTPATDYYYKISAVDLAANDSGMSAHAAVKTLTATEAFPAYLAYGGTTIADGALKEYFQCHIANSSLGTVTINAVEVFDETDSLADSDSGLQVVLKGGEDYSYNFYYSGVLLHNLGGWKVKWYCVDSDGTEFSVIGLSTTPDTTAPTGYGLTSSGVTETSATITWTTNEAATTQVEYGTTAGYGLSSPLDATLVKSHSVTLTGLVGVTTYHFRVKSKDAAGNEAVSGDYTFTTLGHTSVGGVISENTTWGVSGSPYWATANVGIPAGVTLTIEAGTTVAFAPGCKLQVAGTLSAEGTSISRILFTSTSTWTGIEFMDASGDESVLRYCTIENAETGADIGSSGLLFEYNEVKHCQTYGVSISWCTSTITHCSISDCGTGVSVYVPSAVGAVTLTNNTITGNSTGISVLDGPWLTVSANNIYGNSVYDFYCWGFDHYDIAASGNWWGTTDAAAIEQKIYHYNDDLTLPEVVFAPIATARIADAP